jgi:opacity protein-like surface antigen
MDAIKKIFVLSLLFTAPAIYAQVAPAVTGGRSAIWVGGEYSYYVPDYGYNNLNGLGVLFDFNVTSKIGVIGEGRWLHWNGEGGETQSDYLGGVKYRAFRFQRFSLNAKFLLGGVWINYPYDIGSGSYFAYAPGGFVDYNLTRRWLVRADYEYQFLPSAPNIPGFPSNGLQPHGVSFGVEYKLFR